VLDTRAGQGTITWREVPKCRTREDVSSVNYVAGRSIANAVLTPVSATGTICIYALTPVDIIVDINGWFATV
jgi:hypothetical protein